MELGERVRTARRYAKLTQVQLAERVGMEQQTLSDLERGKNATSSKLTDIAFACGVEPLWILREEGPMEAQLHRTPGDMDQLLAAIIALVDTVSTRTQAEGKELGARLRLLREDRQKAGLPVAVLQNLEGVAAAALRHARSRGHRPKTK